MPCRPFPLLLHRIPNQAFVHPSGRSDGRRSRWRIAFGVAAAAGFGNYYLTTGRYLETTDDAYVKADSTIIAPKVSGYISEVLVADNEKVAGGAVSGADRRPRFQSRIESGQG